MEKKRLFLYLLSQDRNNGYDTYDSAVVVAENEDEARNTEVGTTNGTHGGTWALPEYVKVELIGLAQKDLIKGIVIASFNAG